MTLDEAIQKATGAARETQLTRLVIERTDHPYHPGETVYYSIAARDKRKWTPGERCVLIALCG